MSYPLLLLIFSLIVIVPTAFMIHGRSKQKLLANKQPSPKYLGAPNSATNLQSTKASVQQLQIANNIDKYRNHPVLPISFRQLLGKIHNQYLALIPVKLAPDQRFTVDKLVGSRLSEIIEDYLTLDPDYAQNAIIDSQNELTSQDITYGQLTSMLEFMQRIQNDGQNQITSGILANRNYLQSVYGEFHPDAPIQESLHELKAPELDINELQQVPTSERLIEKGHSYLSDCDQIVTSEPSLAKNSKCFDSGLLLQLGQLSLTTESTKTYAEALLGNGVNLSAFDRILTQAIPELLRQALAQAQPSANPKITPENPGDELIYSVLSSHQQALIEQKIARVQQLIDDCLIRLEKVAKQQYQTGIAAPETLDAVNSTLKSKHSQAQYLLDSGFFKL